MPLVVSIRFDAGHGTLLRPNHSSLLFCHAICSSESVHIKQLTSIIMIIIIVYLKILCACSACNGCGRCIGTDCVVKVTATIWKSFYSQEEALQSWTTKRSDDGWRWADGCAFGWELWGEWEELPRNSSTCVIEEVAAKLNLFSLHTSQTRVKHECTWIFSRLKLRESRWQAEEWESFMGEFFKVSLRISCWLCVYESEWFLKSRDLSWRQK